MAQSRHLQWHLFQENYLDPAVPARLPIHGSPDIFLVFQPNPGLLGIVVDETVDAPIAIDRKNIFSDIYPAGKRELPRVFVRDEPLFREFYAICTEVADRVQLSGQPLAGAVIETVEAFDLLLRSAATLSAAEEIGLVGELLVVKALLGLKGPETLQYWRGPERDKHDFRFNGREVEVKTTTGTKPEHWIHGLEQLEASEDCELDLLSVQLARTGGDGGISLRGLVDEGRAKLAAHKKELEVFDDCVSKVVGTARLEQADSHFVLRTIPKAYPVSGAFPRLRKSTIKAILSDSAAHVRDVHYLLNVDNVSPTSSDEAMLEIIRAVSGESS